MKRLKRILSAAIAVLAMTMSAPAVYAETTAPADNGLTYEEAAEAAYELLEMLDYSSQLEMFDGDVDGTWYVLYDYLTQAIYEDPMVFAEIYGDWKESADDFSDLYGPEVIDALTGGENTEGNVTYETKDGVGVITIKNFYNDTDEQFTEAYEQARLAGVTSVVIDLRGNLGGVIDSAYGVLNAIYTEKVPLYYAREKEGVSFATSDALATWKPDILILTDNNTVSAAELVTASLVYNGYARTVGTKTYGKGIGQYFLPLSSGDIIGVTSMVFYLPNGETWHNRSILPDIEVVDDPETEADEVFKAAVAAADGKGTDVKESEAFNYIFRMKSDTEYEYLNTFALIKQCEDLFPKPIRYTYVSPNGMRMIVDGLEAFEAAQLMYQFGIYEAETEQLKAMIDSLGYGDNVEVVYTVHQGDFGFSPTVAIDTEVEAKYFYYIDPVTGEYEAFEPAKSQSGGVLRFNISKGGVIVISDIELE